MKIALQGQEGSFHYQAAASFFANGFSIIPCATFQQVFETVAAGHADRGIVALENSLYGSINASYDLLTKYKPWIIGETYIHVKLVLLGVPGATFEDITDIYSQAPALAEATDYLREKFPAAEQHEWHDTAASAEFVAKAQKKNFAAIASATAGDIYNLDILDDAIEDHEHNYTRFAILAPQRLDVVGANKTSIILTMNQTAGSLHTVLGYFAKKGVNLTKIESRLIRGKAWEYMFYLDFDKALSDPETSEIFKKLESNGNEITILGSYVQGLFPFTDQ